MTEFWNIMKAWRFDRRYIAEVITIFMITFSVQKPIEPQRDISVQFLDFKSGRPIKDLSVTITAFNDYGPRTSITRTSIVFRISSKTDKDGRIIVRLPDVPPNYLRIWSDVTESVPDFSPAEVLKSGSVVPYRRNKAISKLQISAKPGEILIINKRITAWDRVRQEIP